MATTAAGDSRPAVALAGVGRAYGERVALREISFTLARGATVAVFGANGAGKTTLLRILAGLLRPHAGSAHVLGAELPREAYRARGRTGLLGHDPMLYRDLTVRENLRFHARLHRVDQGRADALVAQVGLSARADDPVRTLSRGMTQRAAICRAVLHAPELLLLDEPLANLDPGGAAAVEPLIGRGAGPARVLISHAAERGLAEADHVLGLRGGRQVLWAPAAQVGLADVQGLYA
ncbi:MAG TPA: ABC transporter ATP-binding protein [Solirubrobacteraceae bacterium]|nr:ABC transporter ATP-binding protein [Solirubrobacteraceae bacterium]